MKWADIDLWTRSIWDTKTVRVSLILSGLAKLALCFSNSGGDKVPSLLFNEKGLKSMSISLKEQGQKEDEKGSQIQEKTLMSPYTYTKSFVVLH